MYSKALEEIIEAALADGVLTEKERAVLHKRAAAEGVDPDELDVLIEGRLAKMQKVEKDWLRPSPPPIVAKSDKYGEVRKCPSCGEPVEAGTVKCSACGYHFTGIEGNSSRLKLAAILDEIEKRDYSGKSITGAIFGNIFANQKRDRTKAQAINTFPVPTTKEDLLEFILFLEPMSKLRFVDESRRMTVQAYKTKYKECINKAMVFFSDDPHFQKILPKESKGFWKKFKK